MTTDNPDPLEVGVAKILENEVFGCCIPSIREAREVAAIIAQHYAQVIAENERLREALELAWKEAGRMRKASELVGPYPNDPKAHKVWVRSLYHAGKDLMEKLKPFRTQGAKP